MEVAAYVTKASMAATMTLFFSSAAVRQPSIPSFQTPLCTFIDSFKPVLSLKANPRSSISTRNFYSVSVTQCRRNTVLAVSRLVDGDSEEQRESGLRNSDRETAIDLKLPRRRLLVEFTCNQCGERTKRLINRLAYERGLVFVQCAGCLKHHKLVDNLGLIVEYDYRNEKDVDSDTDQAQ